MTPKENMLISYGKKFKKQYQKANLKIKDAFKMRLKYFRENPDNPTLNNHPLIGTHLGKRSINITGDWRAVYSESINDEGEKSVIFHLLGTHSQLYG